VEVGPEPGQHGQGLDAGGIVQQTHLTASVVITVDFSEKT
jgi:hypothetical protein